MRLDDVFGGASEKRAIPLGTPAALLPQISKLASVEKPCPLSRPLAFCPRR